MDNQTKKRKIDLYNPNLLLVLLLIVFLTLTIFGANHMMQDQTCPSCAVYNTIAFVIIMIWATIFTGYFVWASNFYNIHYGVSSKVWNRVKEAKDNKAAGKVYDEDALNDEPLYNPYADQTFGLPNGTVRGMIAFTLLFGGLALLVVSFGMKGELEPGSFFRDQYEFFKTAFIMMIAFYFGTRSLKYLKQGESDVTQIRSQLNTPNSRMKAASVMETIKGSSVAPELQASPQEPAPNAPQKTEVIVIDKSDPLGERNITDEMPPITAIDPMISSKSETDPS